jgi:hypothetical protein
MIAERDRDRSLPSISRHRLGGNLAIAAILVVSVALSFWTVVETSSGVLILVWTAAWCFGAGVVGWIKRSWFWPGLCPAAMLALILGWVALFGHSSWTSAFITMLGAMFAVAATIGAVVGTWIGKRRGLSG